MDPWSVQAVQIAFSHFHDPNPIFVLTTEQQMERCRTEPRNCDWAILATATGHGIDGFPNESTARPALSDCQTLAPVHLGRIAAGFSSKTHPVEGPMSTPELQILNALYGGVYKYNQIQSNTYIIYIYCILYYIIIYYIHRIYLCKLPSLVHLQKTFRSCHAPALWHRIIPWNGQGTAS